MVAKSGDDGDLFPRGAAPGALPRIKKRNGDILFGPQKKRPRESRQTENATPLNEPVIQSGASLSKSRLSPGMTLLAVIVKANERGIEVALPSGIAGVCVDEMLLADLPSRDADLNLERDDDSEDNMSDSEDDASVASDEGDSSTDGESDNGDDGPIPLWKLLHIGAVLPAAIVDVDKKDDVKKVAVSFMPHFVNACLNPSHLLRKGFPAYAAVRSVEDHGYILSFGSHIRHTAFLPFDNCDDGASEEERLCVGSPVSVITTRDNLSTSKKNKQSASVVIHVTVRSDDVRPAALDSLDNATFQDLRAGMALRARVIREGPGGMHLLFMGVFPVAVDATHIPCDNDGARLVAVNSIVTVRILYVDASLKMIGASLLPALVKDMLPRSVPSSWRVGTFLTTLKVEVVKPRVGLILKVSRTSSGNGAEDSDMKDVEQDVEDEIDDGSEATSVPIFAYITRVSDSKNVDLSANYRKDMQITSGARIISVSRLDGIANVDLRPSILSRKVLSIDEVEGGTTYDCKVVRHTSSGCLTVAVDGDPRLIGIVPKTHVSDALIPAKNFGKHPTLRIGATLQCRALNIDMTRGVTYLTARKSLLNPRFPILTSLEDLARQMQRLRADGDDMSSMVFVGSALLVTSKGNLLVEFCNKIVGMVPKDQLGLTTMKESSYSKEDIEAVYPCGQTVYARVISADVQRHKLLLSLVIEGTKDGSTRPGALGDIVDVSIVDVDVEAKQFAVSCKVNVNALEKRNTTASSGVESPVKKVRAILPFGHLSDVFGMAERISSELMKKLKVDKANGKKRSTLLKSAMLLTYQDDIPLFTLKDSLKNAFSDKKLPSSFREVKNLMAASSGMSTKLRGYVKALLPSGAIVGFLGEAVGLVRKSKIADFFVTDASRTFKINQSVSVVVENVDDEKERFLLSTSLSDVGTDGLQQDTLSLFDSIDYWRNLLGVSLTGMNFTIGSVLKGTVESLHPYGAQYQIERNGAKGTGVVLDVNQSFPEIVNATDVSGNGSAPSNAIAADPTISKGVEKGTVEDVCVMDVDPFTGVVDLSRDGNLIPIVRKKSTLSKGSRFNARVLLVKDAYIILSVMVSKTRASIAFALGPIVRESLIMVPGTAVECQMLKKSGVELSRNLVVIDWLSLRGASKFKQTHSANNGSNIDSKQSASILRQLSTTDESAVVGMKVGGKVSRCFPFHCFFAIADKVVGNLHISKTGVLSQEEMRSLELGKLPADIASRFSVPSNGSYQKEMFITGVKRAFDPSDGNPMIVDLALHEESVKPITLAAGRRLIGFVSKLSSRLSLSSTTESLKQSRTIITVGSSATLFCSDVDCLPESKSEKLEVGNAVLCQVTCAKEGETNLAYGSLSSNGSDRSKFFRGIVESIDNVRGLRVTIPWAARDDDSKSQVWGTVDLCDVSANYGEVNERLKGLNIGDVVRVRRLPGSARKGNDEKGSTHGLTMREEGEDGSDPIIDSDNMKSIQRGAKLRGFVKSISKKGCFVTIGRNVVALIRLCDLSDDFVKNVEETFPVGMLVNGTVDKVSRGKGDAPSRIWLTLRKRPRSQLKGDEDVEHMLEEGKVMEGIVKKVERYGALIEAKPGVIGLLHTSEADQDRFISNASEEWVVGQKLSVVVIKVEGKKISFGTKRCYFEAAGVNEEDVDEIIDRNEHAKTQVGKEENEGVTMIEVERNNEHDGKDNNSVSDVDENGTNQVEAEDEDMEEADEMEEEEEIVKEGKKKVAPLKVLHNVDVSGQEDTAKGAEVRNRTGDTMDDDIEGHDGTGEGTERKRKSREKRAKKRAKEAAETAIRLREEELARHEERGETAEDYERMLMGEPNSSAVWIRYMAFCIELSQMEKARAVAERALETIALEQEVERRNIWVAYVNMEAQFGTMHAFGSRKGSGGNDGDGDKDDGERQRILRDAAVMRVFDRGCERVTDVEEFHLQVANALRGISDGLTDELLKRAVRKFKSSKEVWIARGQWLFEQGEVKAGRQCLERALQRVEKSEHVGIIVKFAQFEYRYGSVERGRTVFESLVGNLAKRVDVWSIYLDMECGVCRKKEGDAETIEQTRRVFERFAALDLSSKKMKFAFKKWLEFEKKFGEKADEKRVKQLAREYVERNVASVAGGD